jgi:hypothetical protein
MNDFKSWLESKTIWMALVAAAPFVSAKLGFDFGTTLNDLLTIVGIAGVIYFRIKASKSIKI